MSLVFCRHFRRPCCHFRTIKRNPRNVYGKKFCPIGSACRPISFQVILCFLTTQRSRFPILFSLLLLNVKFLIQLCSGHNKTSLFLSVFCSMYTC
ncbi:hypothetical protein PHET_11207 [Paragonimus heterotremus]|uniref:Uncharacterized protein n=1 Tax=Paragonimus heterotremus TaxID=100268 RepID=A0A8J4WCH9_9TREM|nr:hypothetical protein PHET_11207 [Paragonimus heterotremus]